MRIIETDNFGSDYPDESFVALGIVSKERAQVMCDALNAQTGEDSARFFRVVEDDYVLLPGFEP